MRKFNKEEENFIRENMYNYNYQELHKKFNERFENRTEESIKKKRERLGYVAKTDGRFKKGHTPYNKGQKMSKERYELYISSIKDSEFFHKKEIGDISKRSDGYWYIKIKDKKNNKDWMPLHTKIWQDHYGEVPKGCMVSFKNLNKDDLRIENLFITNRKENAIMNKKGYYSKNGEITEAGLKIAKLIIKTNERRKNENRN